MNKKNDIKPLLEDEREIKRITLGADGVVSGYYDVDTNKDVTEIVAYRDAGKIPWFAIYRDGELLERVNGRYVLFVGYVQSSRISK